MRRPQKLERQRVAWWLTGLTLLAVVAVFTTAFLGTFVLGLFVYYGARPMHRRLETATGHRGLAATLTLLAIVLPVLLLLTYVGLVAMRELAAFAGPGVLQQLGSGVALPGSVAEAVRDPVGYFSKLERLDWLRDQVRTGLEQVGVVTGLLVHLALALSMSFFLLRDGGRIERWFRRELAGDGSVPHAYLAAVDADLETVYFGNVITVLVVTVLSVVVYNGYNLVAPQAVTLPFPTLLALLTGVATFIPLVVGKIIYLPATGYLVWRALESDAGLLWAPVAFLAGAFFVLDLLPQAVLRPLISGRSLHTGLVLFSYVLGAAYFGWYGLFLGPLLLVLVVQFLNIVLPELAHGEQLTPAPSRLLGLGHDPTDGVEGNRTGETIDSGEDEGDSGAAPNRDGADETGAG
ncbi:MAG: AI-2E family transporter [Halolamina sp.]